MLTKLVFGAAALVATAAFAHDLSNIASTLALQDGSVVHVFKDGKMAMEDRYGRSVAMKEGREMRTADGRSMAMAGNETARLDCIRKTQSGAGR